MSKDISEFVPWKIIIPPKIARQLEHFTTKEQGRLKKAIDGLRNFPHEGDLERLAPDPDWRLRVGGRRIIFKVFEKQRSIGILRIGSRGDIYKR
jgi:mRNA-degrading endonuclease RelE of RelBE toxin-antitoxin system